VECLTYRWKGHSKSDAQVYRAKEEVKDWMDRDPIPRYRNTLIESKVITEKDDRKIEEEVLKEIEDANRFAEESPFPDPSEVEEDVYA
jgi:pyruvate dehydrogenase E1 component alpha subunit